MKIDGVFINDNFEQDIKHVGVIMFSVCRVYVEVEV